MPGEFLKHSGHFLKHRGTEAQRRGLWVLGQRLRELCDSVFPNVRAQLWSELKHRGAEARSYSARWVSLRGEGRVTENEVANWTDASLFALLS